MGDRANVIVIDDAKAKGGIVLYTHWAGDALPGMLKEALHGTGRTRWDDPSYLTRIIFSTMTDGDRGETGFGISTMLGDNEHPYLVVDIPRQVVVQLPAEDEGDTVRGIVAQARKLPGVPFSKYSGEWV